MRAIDLFSGLGGFTTGATQAGATVVWACNHDDAAVRWHAANHPATQHVQQDLLEADWTQVPECELALASPACQGHSQAGQPARKGRGGSHRPDRGRLMAKGQRDRNTAYAVLAMADTLRPRDVIVENVPDFVTWQAFEAWRGMLHAFGYQTAVTQTNALHWGSAQDRPRVIVTARLGAPAARLVAPFDSPQQVIGDCLDPDDHPANRWHPIDGKSARMQERIAKAQRGAGRRCFWSNVSESRGRALDEPFPTSTTKSGSQWNLIDGDRIRVLNSREIARSHGFGDDTLLPANRDVAGRLVGNAIDPRMARGLVEQVAA